MAQTIEELDRQISQLKARKTKLLMRETTVQRKARTRRAIIIGSWVIEHRSEWADEVKRSLIRRQDRELFGLVESPSPEMDESGNEVGGTPMEMIPRNVGVNVDLSI